MRDEEEKYRYLIPVRFAGNEKAYSFGSDEKEFREGEQVVVETARGIEVGEVAGPAKDNNAPDSYLIKPVLRRAGAHDLDAQRRNEAEMPAAMERCRREIERLGLGMNLISGSYTLDRSRLSFTYVAEERVDFRELLRNLAGMFRTRIELRQIGPRDKARMVGGLGPCGMPLCCARFRKDFDVISINMAKNQLLALNPQKLSGQCGKLMCCLAYENEVYKELRQGLPKMNAAVAYQGQRYRVTGMNVLNNTAKLTNREGAVDLTLDQLKSLIADNNAKGIKASDLPTPEHAEHKGGSNGSHRQRPQRESHHEAPEKLSKH